MPPAATGWTGGHRDRWRLLIPFGIALGSCLLMAVLVFRPGPVLHKSLPDFARIDDMEERKAAFFAFLAPYVEEANAEVRHDRARLQFLRGRLATGRLNRRDREWFFTLAARHGLEPDPSQPLEARQFDELLLRMDVIPVSLALAQAALESGWGTSRFARRGNNLFGTRCHVPGCGIVPRHRAPGASYEVARYGSPLQSFLDYFLNLNSNPAYESLWLLREQERLDGRRPSGLALAQGLHRYSQEQWGYVDKIRNMILSNNLQKYD